MARPHMTEQEREAFLAGVHIGVLSVASDSSRPPLTVPVWYAYQPGGNLTFFTNTQGRISRKTGLIQNAGVLSFCVQRETFPYRYVTVEGTVVQVDQPPSAEQFLAIARRYLPEDQARGMMHGELDNPDAPITHYSIHPDRWLTFDLSDLPAS